MACESSQARDLIRAAAASLCPQSRQIQASSMTYTTAQGNTRSLTHGAMPGIDFASLRMLVCFVTAEPPCDLQKPLTLFFFFFTVMIFTGPC